MTYQIVIKDSYEVLSGKYLLEMDSFPLLPVIEKLNFPISVTVKIGAVAYDGQIVLAHYQFTEMIEGFSSYQRELVLLAAPKLSFVGQIITGIEIKM